jgi:hypothetical protein
MKRHKSRRGFLGVRLGQDITPTKGARDCIFDESYTDPATPEFELPQVETPIAELSIDRGIFE